jgi:hypothetical protein
MNDESREGVPAHRVLHVVRRLAAVSLVTALPFLLAGCTVPVVGLAGIGVDDKGAPVGYLQVCHDHLDGATVYTDGKDDDQGRWKASPAVTGFARWSLTDPGEGWTAKTALGQLKPGVKYNLYGWTEDSSSSASNVTFTKEDLVRLKPGQVLYSSGKTNADGTEDLPAVSSESEFHTNACNLLG